jgi:hypothetical protein
MEEQVHMGLQEHHPKAFVRPKSSPKEETESAEKLANEDVGRNI